MAPLRAVFCAVVASLSLSACAPALTDEEVEAKLKVATASVLEVEASAIAILDVRATQTRRIWRAMANGQTYDCDADRSFALPACTVAIATTESPG